jgi:hypothetical protein
MEKLKVDTFSKNDECFVFLQHLKTGDQKDGRFCRSVENSITWG